MWQINLLICFSNLLFSFKLCFQIIVLNTQQLEFHFMLLLLSICLIKTLQYCHNLRHQIFNDTITVCGYHHFKFTVHIACQILHTFWYAGSTWRVNIIVTSIHGLHQTAVPVDWCLNSSVRTYMTKLSNMIDAHKIHTNLLLVVMTQ